jgi:hypothetical protein
MRKKINITSDPFYNACRLDAYVRFLAKHQKVEYELSPEFFFTCYLQGARGFFGIETDESLKIIKDNRYPKVYKEFCKNERIYSDQLSIH